jgi:glyoxylase-like metal-dependent hydrolase (beta-lactamase superfamily II)
MIWLPGHAAGQMGVLIETEKKQYLLAADSVWLKKSYEEMILPNSIVRLFFHSWSDFKRSLKKIHDYHKAYPNTVIIPTHCAVTTDPLISREITLDVL